MSIGRLRHRKIPAPTDCSFGAPPAIPAQTKVSFPNFLSPFTMQQVQREPMLTCGDAMF